MTTQRQVTTSKEADNEAPPLANWEEFDPDGLLR